MVSGKLKMPLDKIKAILDAASVGVYRLIFAPGCKPRMEASVKMRDLLGLKKTANCREKKYMNIGSPEYVRMR